LETKSSQLVKKNGDGDNDDAAELENREMGSSL
jgi:hypothetical protein